MRPYCHPQEPPRRQQCLVRPYYKPTEAASTDASFDHTATHRSCEHRCLVRSTDATSRCDDRLTRKMLRTSDDLVFNEDYRSGTSTAHTQGAAQISLDSSGKLDACDQGVASSRLRGAPRAILCSMKTTGQERRRPKLRAQHRFRWTVLVNSMHAPRSSHLCASEVLLGRSCARRRLQAAVSHLSCPALGCQKKKKDTKPINYEGCR